MLEKDKQFYQYSLFAQMHESGSYHCEILRNRHFKIVQFVM